MIIIWMNDDSIFLIEYFITLLININTSILMYKLTNSNIVNINIGLFNYKIVSLLKGKINKFSLLYYLLCPIYHMSLKTKIITNLFKNIKITKLPIK